MKKSNIISVLLSLALLFCLFSCSVTEDEQDVPDTSVGENLRDREVSDEWESIEIGGEHELNVLFVNVGKADSIIIKLDGLFYMIDTGTSESVPYTLAALEQSGCDKLEAVFLTHPDSDHVGGYSYIRERYGVGTVYAPSICADMYVIDGVAKGDNLVKLNPGEAVCASEGAYFEVLGPIKYNPLDDNDNSLVLRLNVNGVVFLFAGDMKFDEEKTLLSSGMGVECDVLKVGYHGRREATSEDFLSAASPSYAVISTSAEDEKDTADESVLAMLDGIGCRYYITEDFELGILLTVSAEGEVEVSEYRCAGEPLDLKLEEVSKEKQTVLLVNREKSEVDLSGWFIVSDRGGEVFAFPEGASIGAGESVIIACREYDGEYDYSWNESKAWHESKSDRASLIDRWGNLIDEKKSK